MDGFRIATGMRDCTLAYEREEATSRDEAWYRAFVEQVPAVVYVYAYGKDGSTVYMSPRIKEMLGYAPEEWLADPDLWLRLLHSQDRKRVMAEVARAREAGEPLKTEYRLVAKDRRVVWVHDEAMPVKDGEGRPQFWQGVLLNVTERKWYEEALRESEERFRIAFGQAAVGMAQMAPNGSLLMANDKLCEIVGYSREELLGLTFQDLIHPDDLHYASRILRSKIRSARMELRFLRKDRAVVWIDLTISLVRAPLSERDCFISVAEDITERKVAELVSEPLTPREMEILHQIAAGRTNPQIAQNLAYSLGTVKL